MVAALFLLPLACGSTNGAKDGSPADVAGATTDAGDVASPPDVASPGADASSPDADAASPDDAPPAEAGSTEVGGGCKTNAECAEGSMCFFRSGTSCGGSGGVCVSRTAATCPQTRGAGCPCLDVPALDCPKGAGACQGGDQPTGCWLCYVQQ
jgi:hypothetical protein